MADHRITWFVQDRVIQVRYDSEVTLDHLEEHAVRMCQMVDSVDSPLIHLLIDVAELDKYPKQVTKIGPTLKQLYNHPRVGWSVIYNQDDRIIGFLASAITSMFKVRFRSFKTEQEAFEFLNSVDETLPDLRTFIGKS